jgi:hypothetical protein
MLHTGEFSMRVSLLCVLAAVIAGITVAQEPQTEFDVSLANRLGKESLIAYRINRETDVYEVQLLSDDTATASRNYYASRVANLAESSKLNQQRDVILNRLRAERVDVADATKADKDALDELDRQIAKVSRPTGNFQAGEITCRGTDYIGIRELQSNTEFLVPVARILHVISVGSK